MKDGVAVKQRDLNLLGITDYSVLMQIRSRALNDLQNRIPADYYASRALPAKLVIYESENLDRIRHLTRVDFNLANELVEENDRNPTFTPREVSATEVLGVVGYYLMFLALDESQQTPHRLGRMRVAASKLEEALRLYLLHLNENEARLILSALAVSEVPPISSSTTASDPTPIETADEDRIDPADDWKMRCQAEAYKQWVRLRATGANPTVRGISGPVAKWCQANNVRTSGYNRHPTAGYLKIHVLGGKNWDPPRLSVEAAKAHVAQAKITAQETVAQVEI